MRDDELRYLTPGTTEPLEQNVEGLVRKSASVEAGATNSGDALLGAYAKHLPAIGQRHGPVSNDAAKPRGHHRSEGCATTSDVIAWDVALQRSR